MILGYEVHPAAMLFPLLDDERLASLVESIRANGQRDPAVLWQGLLLDGRNRLRACEVLGLKPKTVVFGGEDAWEYVWDKNAERRDLDPGLRAAIRVQFDAEIAKLQAEAEASANRARSETQKGVPKAEAKERRGPHGPPRSRESKVAKAIAKRAKVSPRTAKRALELKAKDAGLFGEVLAGHLKLNDALKQTKRKERMAALPQAGAGVIPTGPFAVIYADPPWRYENNGRGSPEDHYETMPVEDICALPVEARAADDAVLFLWATAPLLVEALRVIAAWGFTYKTGAVWVKHKMGIGFWFRGQHEHLLVATRGKMLPPDTTDRPSSVIDARAGRHSEKPIAAAEMIERMFPTLAKLEMFCRKARPGWVAWGNEVAP